jgi:hypothetical protein
LSRHVNFIDDDARCEILDECDKLMYVDNNQQISLHCNNHIIFESNECSKNDLRLFILIAAQILQASIIVVKLAVGHAYTTQSAVFDKRYTE